MSRIIPIHLGESELDKVGSMVIAIVIVVIGVKKLFNQMLYIILLCTAFSVAQIPNTQIANASFKSSLCSPNNEVCKWDVSQTATGAKLTIAEALMEPCNESGGYEILLLDSKCNQNLSIHQNSNILIKGNNRKPTIWQATEQTPCIILLRQGNLTLENIGFNFTFRTDPIESIIPSNGLISIGDEQYRPSLTVHNCIFHSFSYDTQDLQYHIKVDHAAKLEVINSDFTGMDSEELYNQSFIHVKYCREIILKQCKFKNAKFKTGKKKGVNSFKDVLGSYRSL
ncbi:MAG: hypothetical protein EZS28_024450 [Streblomastix strix]|uniref:Right handed beta helix domain-containing protein n=1 Tax=Streblomastix strix TaxID=222440 RepID=A0A5J4VCD8_9EUKA|nr:MAG: hypothetical protein EZS28_024450 [Streblomastix strix]